MNTGIWAIFEFQIDSVGHMITLRQKRRSKTRKKVSIKRYRSLPHIGRKSDTQFTSVSKTKVLAPNGYLSKLTPSMTFYIDHNLLLECNTRVTHALQCSYDQNRSRYTRYTRYSYQI